MQTGENVANWREKLNEKLQSEDRFNTTEPNKYSGYVYDAVWLYALALDKLIKLNQSYIQAHYIYGDSKLLATLFYEIPSNPKRKNFVSKIHCYFPQNTMKIICRR